MSEVSWWNPNRQWEDVPLGLPLRLGYWMSFPDLPCYFLLHPSYYSPTPLYREGGGAYIERGLRRNKPGYNTTVPVHRYLCHTPVHCRTEHIVKIFQPSGCKENITTFLRVGNTGEVYPNEAPILPDGFEKTLRDLIIPKWPLSDSPVGEGRLANFEFTLTIFVNVNVRSQ